MRLAGDDTVLHIEGEAIRLRPSLRAALRLERRFEGFGPLLQALGDGSITAAHAIIAEAGDRPVDITHPGLETLEERLDRIIPTLFTFALDLAEIEPETPGEPRIEYAETGPKVTRAEAYRQLFAVATGILGWSPTDAWAASPVEIGAALDQRLAMIRAEHGIPEPSRPGLDDQLDSAGLASLADLGAAV